VGKGNSLSGIWESRFIISDWQLPNGK
jgi:hypothetical protein